MSIHNLIWQRRVAWLVIAAAMIALAALRPEKDAALLATLGIGAALLYAVALGMRIRRLRPPVSRENPLWVIALLALVVAFFDFASQLPLFSSMLVVLALLYYGTRTLAALRDRPLMKVRLRKGLVVLAIGLAAGWSVHVMDRRDEQAVDEVVQAIRRYQLARGSYPATLNMLAPEFLPAAAPVRSSLRYYPTWSEGPVVIHARMFRRRIFHFSSSSWTEEPD